MFKNEPGNDETRKSETSKDEASKTAGAGRLISDLRPQNSNS
jgi:hypothetical protein